MVRMVRLNMASCVGVVGWVWLDGWVDWEGGGSGAAALRSHPHGARGRLGIDCAPMPAPESECRVRRFVGVGCGGCWRGALS